MAFSVVRCYNRGGYGEIELLNRRTVKVTVLIVHKTELNWAILKRQMIGSFPALGEMERTAQKKYK